MINQPHDGSDKHDASTTHQFIPRAEAAEHPASENDFTSSESSNQTKKRSRNNFEGEEEEEDGIMRNSSSSSSSSSSSDAPAAQQKRMRTPTTLCKVKGDVLLYLMKFILVDDLKNIVSVNKLFKGIVHSYLKLLRKQPSFSTTDDFSNLNRAFEMFEVLSKLPNYDPNKKVELKLKRGVQEVVGSWTSPYDSTRQQTLCIPCNNLSIVSECKGKTIMFGSLVMQGDQLDRMTFLVGVEGIDASQARNDGGKALISASKNGHLDVVKLLLGAKGINLNQAANNGATALIIASQQGH